MIKFLLNLVRRALAACIRPRRAEDRRVPRYEWEDTK